MLNRLIKTQAAQNIAVAILSGYLWFALRTTRWRLEGGENMAPFAQSPGVIAAFWHECLPVMPALWMRFRVLHPAGEAKVLISRHRDGQLIAAVLRRMHIGTIHGSSARDGKATNDKGGASGLRALLAALANGDTVVLTPDGPRGPARVAAGGVAQLAALSGKPVLACAGQLRNHLRLNSWDRMIVPLPFGRGALVCLPPITVARSAVDEATVIIAAALTQAADRAGLLCK